jgi:hypothetical protein
VERKAGYARVLARALVEPQLNRPLFGKPYLKLGQCHVLWAYFFQLGGVLGARHSTCLDEFALAFLGAEGARGAVERWFDEVAGNLVTTAINDSMTFIDYISAQLLTNSSYKGHITEFVSSHWKDRITASAAERINWHYASEGAALGVTYPHFFKAMFERTHAKVPEAKWERAWGLGVVTSPEQEVTTYEDVERDEDALFRTYCQECCPEIASILWAEWPE